MADKAPTKEEPKKEVDGNKNQESQDEISISSWLWNIFKSYMTQEESKKPTTEEEEMPTKEDSSDTYTTYSYSEEKTRIETKEEETLEREEDGEIKKGMIENDKKKQQRTDEKNELLTEEKDSNRTAMEIKDKKRQLPRKTEEKNKRKMEQDDQKRATEDDKTSIEIEEAIRAVWSGERKDSLVSNKSKDEMLCAIYGEYKEISAEGKTKPTEEKKPNLAKEKESGDYYFQESDMKKLFEREEKAKKKPAAVKEERKSYTQSKKDKNSLFPELSELPPPPSGIHRPKDNWKVQSEEPRRLDRKSDDDLYTKERRCLESLNTNARIIRTGVELLIQPDTDVLKKGRLIPSGRSNYELLADTLCYNSHRLGGRTKLGKKWWMIGDQVRAMACLEREMQRSIQNNVIRDLFEYETKHYPRNEKPIKELAESRNKLDTLRKQLKRIKSQDKLIQLEKELKKQETKHRNLGKKVQQLLTLDSNDWAREQSLCVRTVLSVYGKYCREAAKCLREITKSESESKDSESESTSSDL